MSISLYVIFGTIAHKNTNIICKMRLFLQVLGIRFFHDSKNNREQDVFSKSHICFGSGFWICWPLGNYANDRLPNELIVLPENSGYREQGRVCVCVLAGLSGVGGWRWEVCACLRRCVGMGVGGVCAKQLQGGEKGTSRTEWHIRNRTWFSCIQIGRAQV